MEVIDLVDLRAPLLSRLLVHRPFREASGQVIAPAEILFLPTCQATAKAGHADRLRLVLEALHGKSAVTFKCYPPPAKEHQAEIGIMGLSFFL